MQVMPGCLSAQVMVPRSEVVAELRAQGVDTAELEEGLRHVAEQVVQAARAQVGRLHSSCSQRFIGASVRNACLWYSCTLHSPASAAPAAPNHRLLQKRV